MPDTAGRFRGISVPRIPWHNDTIDEEARMQYVYGVWSEADYYGPHLQSLHATLDSAQTEADARHAADCHFPPGECPFKTEPERHATYWPYYVEQHEVRA